MSYVLGIDIGTTHCKAVALSANGVVLYEATANYPTIQSSPGQSEQDAETIFNTLLLLLQETLEEQRIKNAQHTLTALCFSAAMHSMLVVDAKGKPLTNAYTWADTRSNEYALQLQDHSAAALIYQRTGTPIHPMSPLCKIMWVRQQRPDIFEAAGKFISIKEYIFFRLFGQYLIDHSIASATGLFDIYLLKWQPDALKIAGIEQSKLSTPVPVSSMVTGLKDEYCRLPGLDKQMPFIIGGSDGCLANLGSGAIQPGEAALTIGTSGAVRVIVNHPTPDPQQRLFNYILTDKLYVTGGPVSNGGSALKWFAENFLQQIPASVNDIDWLLQLANEAPAGSEGLIFLPYLSGERAPFWDASAKGSFIGLQMAHRKQHMVRAVLEGISFALCQVMQAVEEINGNIKVVYASGAFVRSDNWLQLMADILNKKIIVSGRIDASALGAALLALNVTGLMKDLSQTKQLIPTGISIEPNIERHSIYKRYFEVYAGLYPKLKDDFHQLEKLRQL